MDIDLVFDDVRARLIATRAIQDRYKAKWIWPEASIADWDAALVALDAARDAYSDSVAGQQDARAALKSVADSLHTESRQVLGIAKVDFRNAPAKLAGFAPLQAQGASVPKTLATAQSVSSAWQKADPAWVPIPGKTLTSYDATRADVTRKQVALANATATARETNRTLRNLLSTQDKQSKAWYAVATRVFLATTPEGDAIRTEIRSA